MKAFSAGFVLLACFLFIRPGFCQERVVASDELIRNSSAYAGKKLVFEGEAIGDIMMRGDYAWININDGNNAIGVWIDRAMAARVKTTGGYSAKGEILRVSGVFNPACLEHGGDLDIHAETLDRLSPGQAQPEEFSAYKISAAFSLAAVLGLLWILNRLKNK